MFHRIALLVVALAACAAPQSAESYARTSELAERLALARSTNISSVSAPEDVNVLFVLIDDLGVERLSVYPGGTTEKAITPTIDLLASFGQRFTRAYSHPTCSPTRVAIHTCCHPGRFGVGIPIKFEGTKELLPDPSTFDYLPDLIPDHYAKGLVGKWHIANQATGGMEHPARIGYDTNRGPAENIGSYTFWPYHVNSVLQDIAPQIFATSKQADDALAFIQGAGNDPWFLNLALNAPHKPIEEPPIELHSYGDIPNTDVSTMFLANVEAIDTELARVLLSINLDVLARTVVIVMADNGTQNDFAQFPGQSKGSLFEPGVNVPLVVWGPGLATGTRDALIQAEDIAMTMIDLCGGELPSDRDGFSFRTYFEGATRSPRSMIFAAVQKPNIAPGSAQVPNMLIRMASNGVHKVIRNDVAGTLDLYEVGPSTTVETIVVEPYTIDEQAAIDELVAFIDASTS